MIQPTNCDVDVKERPRIAHRQHQFGRQTACLLLSLLVTAASGCGDSRIISAGNEDHAVTMRLSNSGTSALQCRLMFGHWVERDLGALDPAATIDIQMMQSGRDGALYVERADGQRQMMIENIVCSRTGQWMESFGQVDFAPIRAGRPTSVTAVCASPSDHERVICSTGPIAD